MPDDLTARLDALIGAQTALTAAVAQLAQSIGMLAQAMAADEEGAKPMPATLDG